MIEVDPLKSSTLRSLEQSWTVQVEKGAVSKMMLRHPCSILPPVNLLKVSYKKPVTAEILVRLNSSCLNWPKVEGSESNENTSSRWLTTMKMELERQVNPEIKERHEMKENDLRSNHKVKMK